MAKPSLSVPPIWRVIRRLNPRVTRTYATGRMNRMILLLTTSGRKSGLPRVTPLQYEELDGTIYVGSARGARADWYKNILAHRRVQVQIGSQQFEAEAEPIDDPVEVARFLEIRLKRHPLMIRAILLTHGVMPWASLRGLEKLASKLTVVAIRPINDAGGRLPGIPAPRGQ